ERDPGLNGVRIESRGLEGNLDRLIDRAFLAEVKAHRAPGPREARLERGRLAEGLDGAIRIHDPEREPALIPAPRGRRPVRRERQGQAGRRGAVLRVARRVCGLLVEERARSRGEEDRALEGLESRGERRVVAVLAALEELAADEIVVERVQRLRDLAR